MNADRKPPSLLPVVVALMLLAIALLALFATTVLAAEPTQPQQQYVLVPRYPILRSLCGLPPAYDARPLYVLRYEPRTIYIPTYRPYVPPSP